MKLTMLFTLACAGVLLACSPKNSDKPQGVISESQQKAITQAKGVEKTLQDENEKRLKEVDGIEEKKPEQ